MRVAKAGRYVDMSGIGIASPRRFKQLKPSQLSGVLEDIVNATVKAGGGAAQDKTEEFVSELIASTPFQKVLNKVHDQAEQAVTDKVKQNGILLIFMAAACGAVGGIVFRGPVGVVAAGGIAALAGWQVMKPSPTDATAKK